MKKYQNKLSVGMHACNSNVRRLRQEGQKFKAFLGYPPRLSKQTNVKVACTDNIFQ